MDTTPDMARTQPVRVMHSLNDKPIDETIRATIGDFDVRAITWFSPAGTPIRMHAGIYGSRCGPMIRGRSGDLHAETIGELFEDFLTLALRLSVEAETAKSGGAS